VASLGDDRRAIAIWVGAGAVGAAIGPGLGGLLTELVSWQSIFLIQVPIAIIAGVPLRDTIAEETREWRIPKLPEGRWEKPHLPANLALALVSAAIAATLFLIVLMLIEGWLLSPIEAAAVVTVLPVAALLGSRPATRSIRSARAASGAILLAGGLAALDCCRRPSHPRDPAAILAGIGPPWCSRR
jgi:MFS family permease